MLKKALVSVFGLLIALGLIINGYSANIDGIDDGYEWDGAQSYILINGESNCDVEYAVMKIMFDNENKALYFCFMLNDPNLESDNLNAGVSFSIADSDTFIITAESETENYDYNKYSFDGVFVVDDNHGATGEVRLGFKEGLPKNVNGTVSFIDGNGMPSNEYEFSVINEGYTENSVIGNSDYYESGYTENKTTKSKNTTKKKDDKTEAETERSSNRRTTTAREGYSTQEFSINTSPTYIYSRTTKHKKTTEKTDSIQTTSVNTSHSKPKSTTQPKTKNKTKTKTKKETVTVAAYYYEKEIIIYTYSETQSTKNSSAVSQTSLFSESDTVSATTADNTSTSVSLAEGTKYKTIVCAVSAVLILLLAVWASGSRKIKKDTSD